MSDRLMKPRYAETIMLDAQAGQEPVLSDVELLARSYLWALEALADRRWQTVEDRVGHSLFMEADDE